MRWKSFIAIFCILASAVTTVNAQTLEIKPIGKTNGTNYAKFDWELKNLGGKKIHPTNPIVAVKYKGGVIPSDDYSHSVRVGEKGNIIIINPAVPPGKHTVKLKIRLKDESIVEKEAEVDFQMMAPLPPTPTPIPDSPGEQPTLD